ncbi:MAG: 2Fe-2S iron-sulfur cluster-binding protein, partial [Desulfobulbaceae bacterium]|nr:2Fe-2S iron-sulfur cluster-binding protein [Desulfobulbaceae bacterium]
MPHLIIDDIPVDVPEGTTVIEAAEQAGIMIPRFCYLKALGSVGACRMCAVSFLAGPVKGIEMSCMVKAVDGMVISTTDNEAVAFRRQMIEWLMVNHPHDCPVCDEGGQCLLQDETISGGHQSRRFPGKKRTYPDQDLGPFIQHEMNRCIHCYRCARFYQEYAGYRDFGVMRLGNRVYYGRFSDGALENPFAGNLVDICPTGVFTDKPARYKARRWDMQRAATLCLHCCLGCNTTVSAFHQAIVRQEARENSAINGSFICDRGRFGGLYPNHAERPRTPKVDGGDAQWQQALDAAVARLQQIVETSGPGAVAVLGSTRASMETMAMLHRCCRELRWSAPSCFVDPGLERKIQRAIARLDGTLAITLGEVEHADFILVVGADPVNEAPMLALALRQAARQGT